MALYGEEWRKQKRVASLLVVAAGISIHGGAFGNETTPAEVVLQERGYGWLLTNGKGMTLYTYGRDLEPGKSACDAKCAETWLPLRAPADSMNDSPKSDSEWSTIVRDDESSQWSFRRQPLYSYAKDVLPGDINGDEVDRGRWQVATKFIPIPANTGIRETEHGHLLANVAGMTLYTPDSDAEKASLCDASCARTWPPLEAPWLAVNMSDWKVITREDGKKQWSFKGKPLHTYAGDVIPGDVTDDGLGTWHVAVLEPPLPIPGWVTVQRTDSEPVLADAQGRTLYALQTRTRRDRGVEYIAIHRTNEWEPVYAETASKPTGLYSIVENKDGTRQWTYKGLLLYVNLRDIPGGLNGLRPLDGSWLVLTQSGKPLRGGTGQRL